MGEVTYIEKDSCQPNVRWIEIHIPSYKMNMTPEEIEESINELRVMLTMKPQDLAFPNG